GPNTYNVGITPVGPSFTVTLDVPIAINDLSLTSPNAILDLTTNTLDVHGNWSQSGALLRGSITAGTVNVDGTASFTGQFTAEALDNVAAFHAHNALIFNPTVTPIEICDSELYHEGNQALWSGGNIVLDQGARYHELASGTFQITSNGTLSWGNTGVRP